MSFLWASRVFYIIIVQNKHS